MEHKLLWVMGKREYCYTFEGKIEFDEESFTLKSFETEKARGGRGRDATKEKCGDNS